MSFEEDRKKILEMLAKGRVSVEEADQLLAALGARSGDGVNAPESASAAAGAASKAELPKYLRVLVEGSDKNARPERVNIRIPLQLVRAGIKLAALLPPEAQQKIGDSLKSKGVNFDLNSLRPENLEELIRHLGEMAIEVDNEREKVRIFCE